MSHPTMHNSPEAIAVIGMSCRFPGAKNIDEFWRNLYDGVELITTLAEDEIEESSLSANMVGLPNYVMAAPLLDDIEYFDAAFFGYTPREAELMDPQHRVFLECSWEAFEHAGYDTESYAGWVGVYGGIALNGYLLYNLFPNPEIRAFMETVGSLQGTVANDRDYVTTRVSYKLNLKGPSFNVQSACSTALVAIHLGCQSLLNYQCDIALAGGASVRVPHKIGYNYQEGGMLSPDGRCRTFDAAAKGTIFGSGVGVVVLKRLSDALADGDTIHAVIKGTAINNDGALKAGFTAPAVNGQAAVVALAQGSAGVSPDTIGYIEAHGTATPIGDPIEVAALTQVFRAGTQRKQFCAIGSVKTNIGHMGPAAGVAGVIKTVLALKHRLIPPSLNYEQPNPKIDFPNSPFYVNTARSEWLPAAKGVPRRAGVSSFGVGGTNAHAVLEEAPPAEPSGPSRPAHLLLLSARSERALETATDNLVTHLKRNPDLNLADVAYTLQVGRRPLSHRRTLVCSGLEDALRALESRDPQRLTTTFQEPRDRPVAFLFSGQGAQYVQMARDLYLTEPVFREHVDRCAELLRPYLGVDLREILYPGSNQESVVSSPLSIAADHPFDTAQDRRPLTTDHHDPVGPALRGGPAEAPRTTDNGQRTTDNGPLNQTQYTQPALFVVEYALAKLWMSWGVQPQAMIGHSIGEYVAACLAGVFSLEDALKLVAERGRLMQSLPAGAMLMVPLAEREVRELLGDQLALAAINSPSRCVVAGPTAAVEALERKLAELGIAGRRLHTSHAFHSAMMEPIVEPFTRQVQRIQLKAPSIPYVSNVTGTWITTEEAIDPAYWARHLRGAVRFADGVRELLREPEQILLEVGPGQTLSTLARQHPNKTARHVILSSLRHPQEQQSDVAFVLNALGQLWLAGVKADWSAFYSGQRRQRVPLPTYPFERQRFWIDPPKEGDSYRPRANVPLRKNPDLADWFYIPSWKRSFPPTYEPGGPPANWLVLSDACGLGARLARRLEQEGQSVVTATAAEQFARLGERAYTLNPRQPEDYTALLADLRAMGALPQAIVHLWSVTAGDEARSDEAHFARSQDLGFYSLIFLTQALGHQDLSGPLQLAVVSNGVQAVAGELLLVPEKATLLGPCKVIRAEYSNITCRSIDVVLPPDGEADELAEQIIAEITTDAPEMVVAYRGYDRWVQTYESSRLGEPLVGRTGLREQGVYLITGGLGGIGMALAQELAQSVRARLVLTGRSAFPEPAAWDTWLATHDEQDSVSDKIRKLRELEAMGAEVLVVSADAADEAQMRAVVEQTRARYGPIHGVIHSAGIASGGIIALKTREVAEQVMAPKVRAVRAIERALADARPDFMVLCSSMSSLVGSVGQVDYAAGNAFLDAYAHYNTARGLFTVSINWDAWDEVGMLVNTAASYGLVDTFQGDGAKELPHPLLDSRTREATGQEVYRTRFDTAEHWVLAEHKVMGVPTLPGTTYLEMARAAFEPHAGDGTAEIRDVFFLTPLMIVSGQKETRLILEGDGEGGEFRVVSRQPAQDATPVWQEHVRGKVGRLSPEPPRRYNLAELRARCAEELAVDPNERGASGKVVYWGPRWMSLKRIHIGAGEVLGALELPEEFAADVDQYGLHPALLDVATSFAIGLVGDGGGYLPLSYGRLAVRGRLPAKLYSYVRYQDSPGSANETLSFDIALLDEQGVELVTIDEFTLKRVNQAAGRLLEAVSQEVQPADSNGMESPLQAALNRGTKMLPREGVEAFKRILSRNRLPQIAVVTRDLPLLIERAGSLQQSNLLYEIDRASQSRTMHARPEMQTAYAAPANELEQNLALIWSRILGIEQVGIHDNFFDLGGDSVLAVQIIARAADAGIQLTPAQLFQHQTIADLAASLGPILVAQTRSEGVPLTPIQHWFFEQDQATPERWSRAVLLEVPQPLDPALLEQSARQVIGHHDALRLRFVHDETGWRQVEAEALEQALVSHHDLSSVPLPERPAMIDALAAQVQNSLSLEQGPLLRLALLDYGADQPGRLLLVIHRLIADAVAWTIVLEDLWKAYESVGSVRDAVGAVREPPLRARTATFRRWAERLAGQAQTDVSRQERSYWREIAMADGAGLPLDPPEGTADDGAATEVVRVALGADATRTLLEEAPRAYRTRTEEVLLTALGEALARWTGAPRLLVELEIESGGRDSRFDDLDLDRTVGSGTIRFPFLLNLRAADPPGEALKALKEQLRAVPGQGLGYGLQRYLAGDETIAAEMRAWPQPALSFGYQAPIDHGVAPLRNVGEPGADVAGELHGPLLAISGRIAADRLHLEWRYQPSAHRRATIERLAGDCIAALEALIAHCRSPEFGGFTPSDFPEAGLSQAALDKILGNMKGRAR